MPKTKKLTNQQLSLLDGIANVRSMEPEQYQRAFMARHLIQCTLPHDDPGDVPAWSRQNGGLKLTVLAGRDQNGKSYGYPHGTVPRLLLYWIVSEATLKKSPRLELGKSLAQFMLALGMNPYNGTCERSDKMRLRKGMETLFNAILRFDWEERSKIDPEQIGLGWETLRLAKGGMLWWDKNERDALNAAEKSYIVLDQDFYNAISTSSVPLPLEVLKVLKQSPLALDLYSWVTYRVSYLKAPVFIPWSSLVEQLGCDYDRLTDFQQKAQEVFRKIKAVYPELRFEIVLGSWNTKGGLRLFPSPPAIPMQFKSALPA